MRRTNEETLNKLQAELKEAKMEQKNLKNIIRNKPWVISGGSPTPMTRPPLLNHHSTSASSFSSAVFLRHWTTVTTTTLDLHYHRPPGPQQREVAHGAGDGEEAPDTNKPVPTNTTEHTKYFKQGAYSQSH